MLVNNPFTLDEKLDPQIPSGTLQVYEAIGEDLKKNPNTEINRASAASMCVRRRWYQKNGTPPEDLAPRKIVNFTLGDLAERTVLHFIQRGAVGPGKLYSEVDLGTTIGTVRIQGKDIEIHEQKTLSYQLQGYTITGHADGFGKRNSDGNWELIEVKSAADYGFKEFQEKGPGDYLKQSHALLQTDYAKERNVQSVRFWYLKKQTGHIWDRLFKYDEKIASQVNEEFIRANEKEIPEDPYGYTPELFRSKPTGRLTIPWQCQYCSFTRVCKGDFKIEWKQDQFGHMKPLYIFEKQ